MAHDITIEKVNHSFVRLHSNDRGLIMELAEAYTFYVDGYKFMPSYRNKMWDGKIRLLNMRTGMLPAGLLENLKRLLTEREYTFKVISSCNEPDVVTLDEIRDFIKETHLPEGIELREYQIEAFCMGLIEKRKVIVSPTGSGKSLIIYLLVLFAFYTFEEKILVIVPTTGLVEQLYKDFAEYSVNNDFEADGNVHRIYSGKDKVNFEERIVITTWQSAIKCPRPWFDQFGMVIGDEAHLFKAKSLNQIMESLKNASFRLGTTGTLDGSQVHELVLTGHFGDPHKVVSTKELIDNDTLAELQIQCLVLKYSEQERKAFGRKTYQEEIDYIVAHEKRNAFIRRLALTQEHNTLVLFNLVQKHGKPLFAEIQKHAEKGRKVFYVAGSVAVDDRERIREITEREENAIIVASMGTFSTGVNIKNLSSIIFAAPTKSQIRVLQSIGRGLRRTHDGKATTIFDISDDFSWKKRLNYTLKHGMKRAEIYHREQFDADAHVVKI